MATANSINANQAGVQCLTSAGVWNGRTITAGTGISISNGDGVSGNPTITATSSALAPGVQNLGITYSSSTFTVTSANGTALSASNPAYVTLQSKSAPGKLVTITVTADQTFIDDTGASTIVGNLFGLTTGIAYANAMPFFIYAVLNDSENAISFMISRYPNTKTSPPSANIGKTGSAVADTTGSFFALSNPTVTDYDSNPCLVIGAFTMTMSSSDDWTVSALGNTSGIGQFHQGILYTMVTGQFGAASGKYFQDNGGTAPAFTTSSYSFRVNYMNNTYTIFTNFASASTAGVGAVVLRLALPYQSVSAVYGSNRTNVGATQSIGIYQPGSGNATWTQQDFTNAGGGGTLNNSDITLGSSNAGNAEFIISFV